MGGADITYPVALGIVFGLFVGKPIGIMLVAGGAAALHPAKLPDSVKLEQKPGVGFTCGIGFTMSLFIAGPAVEHSRGKYYTGNKLEILIASTLSTLAALFVFHKALPLSGESVHADGPASCGNAQR
jgi:NhaA family Na+:H+ antiporter